ncbi:titin homolog [Anopheles marshallii]|uniref:titin homolog n=1 Tax=Anopheles marshallii TaxID=1521116 RepID=UPI00237A668D|nr:titin homolog [Anopheles marshallii]
MAKKGKAKNGAATGEGEQVTAPAAATTNVPAADPVRPAPVKEVKLEVKPAPEKNANPPKQANAGGAVQNGSEGETGEMRRKRSRRGRKKKSDDASDDQSKDKAPSTVTARKNLRKKRSKLMRTLEQLEANPAQAAPEGKPTQTPEDIRKKIQIIESLLQHLQAQTQEEKKKMESLRSGKAEPQEPAKNEQQQAPKVSEPAPKNLTTEKARKEGEVKKLANEKVEIQNEAKRLAQEKARKEQEMKRLIEEKAKKDAEAKQLLEEKAAREAELVKLTQAKARVEKVEQKINEIDQKVQQRKEADEPKVAPGSPKQSGKKEQARTRKDSESNKKKEAEEKVKKEAEEKAKKEAEEKAKKEAAENAKKEAEEKAKKEAAEKAKKEAEEKAKKEAEEKAKKEAAEKAKKEAEEKAKKEAAEKAKKEAAEKAKKEAEEKAKKEAAEKAKKEAEEKAKKEAAEKAKKEAEEKAKKEAAEKAKKEAEEKAKKEAAEKAKKEAEEKAKKEAAEKAKKEAEEKAKKEAAEKAKKEAEEKAKKEAAEKAKKEAEEKAKKEAAEKAKKEAEEKAKLEAADKAKKLAEEEAKRKTNGEATKQSNGAAPTTPPTQEKPATSKQDAKNSKKNNKRTPKNSVSEDEKSTAKVTGPKNGQSGDFASSAEPVTVAKSQESQSAPVPIPKTPEVAPASPKSSPKPGNGKPAVPANGKPQTPQAKPQEKSPPQPKTAARTSPPKTTAKAPSPPKAAPAAARAPPKPSTPPASKKPEPPPKPEFLKRKSPSVEKEKIVAAKVAPAATAPQQVPPQAPAATPSPSSVPAPSTPAPVPAPATVPAPASPAPAEPAEGAARLTEEALNGAKKPATAGAAAASKSKPAPPKKPEVPPKPDVHNKSAAKMKTPIKQPGGKTSTSDSRSPAVELSRTEAFKKNMDIISTIADVLLSHSRSKKNRGAGASSDAGASSQPTTNSSTNPPSSTSTSLDSSSPSSASLLSSLFPSLSQSSGPAASTSRKASSPPADAPKPKSKLDLERILRILQASQPPSRSGGPEPGVLAASSSPSGPEPSTSAALPVPELPPGTDTDEHPLGSFLTKDAIRMLMPTLQEVNVKFNVEKQLQALNATAAMAKILPKTLPPGTDTTEEDELEEDLLDEETEDTIEYKFTPRPVFIATICQVCKNPLKSFFHCERCAMVSYCGEEHRRLDQPSHRDLCAVLCEIAANRGGHIYQLARKLNVAEYRNLRVHTLNQIELSLKRCMQAFEREIVLFPRICLAPDCREWRQELLAECTDCRQVSYCVANPTHLQASHRRWCKAYLLFQKLILRQRILGRIEPVLPTRILTKSTPLPANTDEAFKQLYKNSTVPRDECVYAVLSQIATAPLSALYAFQQTGLPFGNTFTIHLVGAELQFEGDTLDKWEAFFLHLVPEVAVLRVVFVGPELNVENLPIDVISRIRMCRTCRMKCRVVAFDFQCRTMYHDYRHSSRYQRPNLICFFNPGLHRTTGFAGLDSWPTTIHAATEAGCPMLVTAYTELESPLDLERLQRESTRTLQIVQPPSVNPFASKRPDRNFISDDTAPMIFKNYYYFVVK